VEAQPPSSAGFYLYRETGTISFIACVCPSGRFDVKHRRKVAFNGGKAQLFDAATGQVLK
jgi:hypothetical protein